MNSQLDASLDHMSNVKRRPVRFIDALDLQRVAIQRRGGGFFLAVLGFSLIRAVWWWYVGVPEQRLLPDDQQPKSN